MPQENPVPDQFEFSLTIFALVVKKKILRCFEATTLPSVKLFIATNAKMILINDDKFLIVDLLRRLEIQSKKLNHPR